VRRQQLPSAPHKQPVRPRRISPISLEHVLPLREQRRENHPPRATPSMQLRRLQRVVKPNPLRQFVTRNQNNGRHKTTHDSRPRLNHRTTGRDGGEPSQQTVADIGDVPVTRQQPFPEERGQRSR